MTRSERIGAAPVTMTLREWQQYVDQSVRWENEAIERECQRLAAEGKRPFIVCPPRQPPQVVTEEPGWAPHDAAPPPSPPVESGAPACPACGGRRFQGGGLRSVPCADCRGTGRAPAGGGAP